MWKALTVTLVGSVLGTCILTPVVYEVLLNLLPGFKYPFSRVFDRVIMVLAGGLIWYYWSTFRESNLLTLVKVAGKRRAFHEFFIGLVVSVIVAGALVLTFIMIGYFRWTTYSTSEYIQKGLKIVSSAFVIAILEEIFFRVIVFKSLLQKLSFLLAAISTSLFFATIHFLSPVKSFQVTEFNFLSGFKYIEVMLERLLLPGVGMGWIGLFFVGMFLCYVMYKTESLYLCIGIHAGWVLAVKSFGFCFRATELVQFVEGIGARYFVIAHPIGWTGIAIQWLLMLLLIKYLKLARTKS